MAEIYLAAPEGGESRHRLAIKVIHQQNADDPDFVRMLVDEARLAVQLKHPNIVTTYDLGLANDQYYIVMELVEGADLFRLQQRAADQRLSFPIPLAAYIAREVARGLDYAHRLRDSDGHPLQVVHRDISPQNVLLSYEGAVKITDFGIAKAARRAAQTQAGIIKGKYYYMSPEQASGQFIDGRTDIFAAGILLYEMLIGEMLYYDDNVERLLQVVRKADIPPVSQRRPDTPPALERILMKALSKSPSDRYQTAAEYSQALDNYLRRYAPRLGAADVGAFLEKLIGERARRRTLNESTAALAVSAAALNEPPRASAVSAGGDATVGLSSGQLHELGISDENSLIFQSKGLAALLQGGGSSSGVGHLTPAPLAAAAPAGELAGNRADRADDETGRIRTTRLSVDSPKLASRRSSSGTMEVVVPSLRSGGSSASSSSPEEPSGEVPAESMPETPSEARRSGPRPARSLVSKPSEVFRAIEPEVEEELLAGAAELTREPYALTAPRRILSSGTRHEPLAAQLASAEVTVPRAEVPPELLAALMPRAEDRVPAKPASVSSPAAAPREPVAAEPSAKVELLQSDLAFSDPSHLPVGPSVELAQSDSHFSDPQFEIIDSKVGHAPVRGAPPGMLPGAASDPSLDAISAESTHSNLRPPPGRPEPDDLPPASYPEESIVPLSRTARMWPYWVSGLSAALLSAGLTWYVTGPGAHRASPPTEAADLRELAHPEVALILPGVPVSAVEPPPAGEPTPEPPSPPAEPARPDGGELILTSKPEGAEVYINKKLVGQTPLTLRDQPLDKALKVELRLAGYKTQHKRIKWHSKLNLAVLVQLHPEGEAESGAGRPEADDGPEAKPEAKPDAKPDAKPESGAAPKAGSSAGTN